jgi:dipeptidyl aminopeptidase/acylaminoacyl peptidase
MTWTAIRFALAIVCILPARALDAQGRPLTIEDWYRIRTVGGVQLSPDARWVAYTITTRHEANNADSSEVWLASADAASPPRRVSPPGIHATGPSWDSTSRLTFLGRGCRWSVDPSVTDPVDGAACVTQQGAQNSRGLASPDGKRRLIVRPVQVPRRDRTYASDFERRHEERFRGVQFDWLNFQQDGQPFPVPNRADPVVFPAQELFVSSNGDTATQQLTRIGLRPSGVQWNTDGTLVLFTADMNYRDERQYASADVYTVALDGRVSRVTMDSDYHHTDASFSPDGRWILYTRQLSTNAVIARKLNHGGPTDLAIVPAGGGRERVLTAAWDYLPSNATWSPDSRFVYFTGGIGGTTHLFRVDVRNDSITQITKGERRITGISFDRTMSKMAYTVGVIDAPADIYVANIDGSGERRITTVNEAITREIALSKADRVLYQSKDGTQIEGWLLYPHGYRRENGPYPLIVASHGGPHAADGYSFNFKDQFFAANGYFVLRTNFRSSTGYGEKFLWGTWGAWGEKDGQDVMAGVDYVIGRYPIDRQRVAAIGHSYGGFMTNWLITQYPDRFAAAIPGAGIVNWVSDYGTADIARTKETEFFGYPWEARARDIMIKQSPLTYADRVKAPTLFIHGEIDQRVPYSEAEQMYVALKKLGVPARMIQYAGQAHGIGGSWNNVHRMLNELRWLDTYLKGRPTP